MIAEILSGWETRINMTPGTKFILGTEFQGPNSVWFSCCTEESVPGTQGSFRESTDKGWKQEDVKSKTEMSVELPQGCTEDWTALAHNLTLPESNWWSALSERRYYKLKGVAGG